MRVLLIVIDGVGDRPVVRGKTPLQLARHPNLDALAASGSSGLSDPLGPGIVPGSDTGHLALLGYDPSRYYVGRGILEALGAGMKIYEGDVALRANFATVDARANVVDRRAGRIGGEDAEALAKAIEHIKIEGIDFVFATTKGHRGVLIMRGNSTRVSPLFTNTDPQKPGPIQWARPIAATDEAKRSARAINEWTKVVHKILKAHAVNKRRAKEGLPVANIIIVRGPSSLVEGKPWKGATYFGPYVKEPVKIQIFGERYRMRTACIAGGTLYKGIARYVGMEVIDVKGATADLNTDLRAKISAVQRALNSYDFVFLHIKGCDPAGHDGDWKAKTKFIEKIDGVLSALPKENVTVVTSDHSTPCALRTHSADPVPITIAGEGVRIDGVRTFDEISCSRGALGKLKHLDVIPILFGILGKAQMYGT